MINQVPNLNHYPINTQDERFGFLPFLGGLTVGALAGGFGGSRPCGPMCGPQFVQPMPMPMPQPMFIGQPQFQPIQSFPSMQGPIIIR